MSCGICAAKEVMNRRTLHDIRLVVAPLLFCWALSGPAVTREAHNNYSSQNSFAVAGVALGMDFESVLNIYPTATIDGKVANCYSYGRAVGMPMHTRKTLRHRHKTDILALSFEPPSVGGRLDRIHYDRAIDLTTGSVRKLLDGFSAHYGRYDRILHRRKMEPAGRIVGFEWQSADGATLRFELRHDYSHSTGSDSSDGVRLSILARSAEPASRPQTPTLSLSCGEH